MQDHDPNVFQPEELNIPDLGDQQTPTEGSQFLNPDGTVSTVIGEEDPRATLPETAELKVFSGAVQSDTESNPVAMYPGLPATPEPTAETSSYQQDDEQGNVEEDADAVDATKNSALDENLQSDVTPGEQAFSTGIIGDQVPTPSTEAGQATSAYPEFASDQNASTEPLNLPDPEEDPQQPEQ